MRPSRRFRSVSNTLKEPYSRGVMAVEADLFVQECPAHLGSLSWEEISSSRLCGRQRAKSRPSSSHVLSNCSKVYLGHPSVPWLRRAQESTHLVACKGCRLLMRFLQRLHAGGRVTPHVTRLDRILEGGLECGTWSTRGASTRRFSSMPACWSCRNTCSGTTA